MGVQFELFVMDSYNRTTTSRARQSGTLKWVLFIAVSPLFAKLRIKNMSPKGT